MQHFRPPQFRRALAKFPPPIQKAFEKQLRFLLTNIRHPSLRAKKYDETTGVWQARVTSNVRFYFVIEDNAYLLLNIEKHKD